MRWISIRILITVLVLWNAEPSLGQRVSKCVVTEKKPASYDLVMQTVNTLPPYILSLRLFVKSNNYNDDYMIRLARTISQRYCKNQEISVTIFDDKKRAKRVDLWEYHMGRIEVPELRGFFSLGRDLETGRVSYSTQRGNSTNEKILDVPWKD